MPPDRLTEAAGLRLRATESHTTVSEEVAAWLAACGDDPLAPVYRWALTPPGKLVRPVLLLEAAKAVGGCAERVAPAAVGIELAHAGSLTHDDIIDGDDVRRGRPAAHRRFGTAHAILTGDALYFAMFEQLAECRRRGVPSGLVVEATEAMGAAGQEVACGVAREIALSGWLTAGSAPDADPVGAYVRMVGMKTAALVRTACLIGALLGGGSRGEAEALERYGAALGIAFQMRDDLLPYRPGPAAPAGKPACSDLRNQRPALPLLLAHRLGGRADRALLAGLCDGTVPEGERQDRLRRLVADTGALAAARRMAEEYVTRCHRELLALPPSPHRELLAGLADLLADDPGGPGGPGDGDGSGAAPGRPLGAPTA